MQVDRSTAGGMPPRKVRKKTPPAAAAAAASGRDRLIVGDLPDCALQRVLSFLPAQDAVRTCLLARRWRHVWKSAAGLRILCGGGGGERRKFADNLLRVRGSTPIDTCEFRLLELDEDDVHRIDVWIRHVLQFKVRVLRINKLDIDSEYDEYVPVDLPLISQHLKKLQLQNIYIFSKGGFLDFSSCPVLEDLEIHGCDLSGANGLSSQSLKRLSIDGCQFPHWFRMKIYTPNLVSLWLKVDDGMATPSFEGMPSLLEAVAKINNNDWGHLPVSWPSCDDCLSYDCDCHHYRFEDDDAKCFLLHSLSEARSLALIAHDVQKDGNRRELKFYPTFNKLKTLILNEYWCEPPDFSALARLLEHSPVLEKLTLQLYSVGPKHNVEIKLNCKPKEKSAAASVHLSTVEIKCEALDERVLNVLKFLGTLDICKLTDISSARVSIFFCSILLNEENKVQYTFE